MLVSCDFSELGKQFISVSVDCRTWSSVTCSRRGQFTIVPILVGSLTLDREQSYGQLLARYLADPDNLFVISSDFCHWG